MENSKSKSNNHQNELLINTSNDAITKCVKNQHFVDTIK